MLSHLAGEEGFALERRQNVVLIQSKTCRLATFGLRVWGVPLALPFKSQHAQEIQKHRHKPRLLFWLGKGSLFQTFDGLDSIIDKETEIKKIRKLL